MSATDTALHGVVEMPEAEYHRHPALSASLAKLLLPPSVPAKFRWIQQHGHPPKDVWDIGSAAHKLVLRSGPDIIVIEAPDWRTKAAREARDEARAAGNIPVLEKDYRMVSFMAQALRKHPVAAALFDPERGGNAEQSLFWEDPVTGTPLRCRLDWLPADNGQRMIVGDYKTCSDADLRSISKSSLNWAYYLQAAWYLEGVKALGLDDNPAFVFVFQEKTAPYLVQVVELDHNALEVGRRHMRQAIDLYVRCAEADEWPGYSDEIELVSLPDWFVASEAGDLMP